jgi:hypothetical protein
MPQHCVHLGLCNQDRPRFINHALLKVKSLHKRLHHNEQRNLDD